MTVYIDYQTALSLVNDEVAKEGPDFVYEKISNAYCANTVELPSGEIVGSCLVGRALIAAGVDPVVLHQVAATLGILGVASKLGDNFKITGKAINFLQYAQAEQDKGRPWGEAVMGAFNYVSGLPESALAYES